MWQLLPYHIVTLDTSSGDGVMRHIFPVGGVRVLLLLYGDAEHLLVPPYHAWCLAQVLRSTEYFT